jgi:SAM-dependent methyltransferase
MAATVQEIMDERGYKTKIQAGSNRSLPYPDAYFDLLLSVNTLHYEGTEENFLAALSEFRRVLKPGGGLYISTVGPEHEIYRRAEVLGDHRYRIRDFDFRNGEEFFFCDSEHYLQHYCMKVFDTVETGRSTEKLIKLPLDFLIALCR